MRRDRIPHSSPECGPAASSADAPAEFAQQIEAELAVYKGVVERQKLKLE